MRMHAGAIFSYFTRHGTAANLVLVVMLAAGIWAIPNMRSQFFPDVVVQSISVSVGWSGAGAEDVDRAIVQLLEPTLLVVEGVSSATSRASEGRAVIALEFEPNWDMSRALEEVQAAVDGVSNLPDEADTPVVRRSEWRDRVTDVVISGPVSVDQLGRFADEFVTRLFAAGVTRTTIQGLAAPDIVVEVPSRALIQHDIGMSDIATAIASTVRANPAGEVSGASARVRTGTARRSAEEIAAITLRTGVDGSVLTVGDLAEVRMEGVDRSRAYFVGDNPAMTIRVDRSAQGDAIGIQRDVERVAADLRLTLPDQVTLDLIRSRTEEITGRLNLLLDNALMGLGLVVVLLFLFLNARVALWVAAGIPVAMISAIAAMYAMGLTINMISLFALIITLGIVVDDAIVVGEHADYRARELGEGPAEAAENAASRMAAPVFSATITTVIAFFGLVAVGGRFGSLIADIPLTVIAVLIASLVECFLILPNHLRHSLAHVGETRWYDWPSTQVNRGFLWVRERLFRPFMGWVIWARYPVLAGAILLLALQGAAFLRGDLQWRFFNSPEEGSIAGNFAMLPAATRSDTLEMMRELQRATEEVAARYEAEHGRPPLEYAIAEIGGNAGRGLTSAESKEDYQLGGISIGLIDIDQREFSAFQFVADLQEAVRPHPMLEEVSFRGGRSGPGGDSLAVQFFGADVAVLKSAAEALKSALAPFPEVSALEDSLAYDKEELVLELTAQGQALGFTIDGLGRTLRNRLSGIEAATFPDGPRSSAIRVELPEAEMTADFLETTLMRTASGQYVPLADVVTVERRSGFATIRRENGLQVVSVSGDISEDDPARAAEISATLRDTILPAIESSHGVAWRMAGLAEQEQEFLSDAGWALIYCLLGIYLVLAWIFGSWTRPMVVMAVIPFGLVGALYGHGVWGMALSMFSVVGLIGMVGIIINDSIVLVTTVDQYARQRGMIPAIIDGACDRLRPVLLTTLTTVLGLAPLLYESSSQAEFLKPTVVTLVFGLGFGMVLVLLVVPALMAVQGDLARQMQALRRGFRAAGPAGHVMPVAAMLLLLWFALTVGRAMLAGAAPGSALAMFLGGALVLLFLVYAGAALYLRRHRQPGQPSSS
ncbi:efflux RND transporter permease subunit [Plastorhodobacter daqingensis]|uniref:Efflux RND transporter permease subunit n=1 Tax=Plastorhodobacter daqingensis TaxID=1387281 RepID=A0ABW2UQF0_9RHOB